MLQCTYLSKCTYILQCTYLSKCTYICYNAHTLVNVLAFYNAHTLVNVYLRTVPLALTAGRRIFSLPSWNIIKVGSCLENDEVLILYLQMRIHILCENSLRSGNVGTS